MIWFLGIFIVTLGIFFSLNWFMRADPSQILGQIRHLIRFLLLFLASQGGIFRIFSLFLPFIWGFRRYRANSSATSQSSGTMGEAEARELLGVPSGASEAEINRAWRSLMVQAHPDKGGSHEEAARINHAREFLLKKGL